MVLVSALSPWSPQWLLVSPPSFQHLLWVILLFLPWEVEMAPVLCFCAQLLSPSCVVCGEGAPLSNWGWIAEPPERGRASSSQPRGGGSRKPRLNQEEIDIHSWGFSSSKLEPCGSSGGHFCLGHGQSMLGHKSGGIRGPGSQRSGDGGMEWGDRDSWAPGYSGTVRLLGGALGGGQGLGV